MKKITALLLSILLLLSLPACGEADTTNNNEPEQKDTITAIILMPDGNTKTINNIKGKKLCDKHAHLICDDGTIYIVAYDNVIIIQSP